MFLFLLRILQLHRKLWDSIKSKQTNNTVFRFGSGIVGLQL